MVGAYSRGRTLDIFLSRVRTHPRVRLLEGTLIRSIMVLEICNLSIKVLQEATKFAVLDICYTTHPQCYETRQC